MQPAQDKASLARLAAITRLIDDVRAAYASGKEVDEQAILAAHPELMPELSAELEKLRRVRAARAAADTVPPGEQDSPDWQRPAIQAPGYSIVRELSRGGQAVVYLAMQLSTGREVVLKVMREGPLADDRALARFKREVQALAALNHPNIVTIFDTGRAADGSHFIAMKYIPGVTLDDYMKHRLKKDSSDPSRLLRLFLKICAAVNAAHARGIVHRDLKPTNIRIDERGEPHILDFGLARMPLDKLGGEQTISITGEFLGSLPWCSPEQAEGDPEKIDSRTDVYSLGVILYQILTGGRFPYEVVGNIRDVLNNVLTAEPTPPSKMVAAFWARQSHEQRRPVTNHPPAVNEAIEKVVLKALAKKREDRYQSAGELGRDIADYLSGRRTSQRELEAASARRWTLGKSLAVVGGVLACILAFGAWRWAASKNPQGAMVQSPSVPATQPQAVVPTEAVKSQSPLPPGAIDLLAMVHLPDDAIQGSWTPTDSGIESDGVAASKLRIPYRPHGEYDLELEFVPLAADPEVYFVLSYDGHEFFSEFIDSQDKHKVRVGGLHPGGSNGSGRPGSLTTTGQSYRLTWQVRRESVAVLRDGKLWARFPIDSSVFGFWNAGNEWKLDPGLLGLQSHSHLVIRSLILTPGSSQAPPEIASEPVLAPNKIEPEPDVSTNSPVQPPSPSGIPADAKSYFGHHFKFIEGELSWTDAAQRCRDMGGHLARPTTSTDQDFFQQLKGDNETAWVGGSADDAGNWTWSDGQPIPPDRIASDGKTAGYNCLFLMRGGKLAARPDSGRLQGASVPAVQGFICEWDK